MKLQYEFAKFSNYLNYIVIFWQLFRKVAFHFIANSFKNIEQRFETIYYDVTVKITDL